MTRQNRTELSSKINFLGSIQLEPWREELHQGNPEVLGHNPTIGLSFKLAQNHVYDRKHLIDVQRSKKSRKRYK